MAASDLSLNQRIEKSRNRGCLKRLDPISPSLKSLEIESDTPLQPNFGWRIAAHNSSAWKLILHPKARRDTTMLRSFLVTGLLASTLLLGEASNNRSVSQRISRVLRRPLQQSTFHRQTIDRDNVSSHRDPYGIVDLTSIPSPKGRIMRRSLKGHRPHSYGQYFSANGKDKGKSGKSKSEKSKKKEKKHGAYLPSVCENLDFRSYYSDTTFYGHSGKGKGKGSRTRHLQFQGPDCDMNVFDVARDTPELSTFVHLIEAAYLEDLFLCAGPFSILAPTNTAFEANPSVTDHLLAITDVQELREVLLYHILPGLYLKQDFDEGQLSTLQGGAITISLSPLSLDGSVIDDADLLACNGAIQAVDQVLVPRSKYTEDFCCINSPLV